MRRDYEEILEAIWTSEEYNDSSLKNIEKICHTNFDENLLKEMQKDDLIAYDENNIYFTGKGKEIAQSLIRRKRLGEELLEHVLQIRGEKAKKIVCEFEHSVIPEVEESICILLGHPVECPHGRPIPPGACCLTRKNCIEKKVDPITNFNVNDKIKISYIRPQNHQRLHKLISFGLKPGTIIEIHQTRPTFIIKYDRTEIAMDREIAENIYGWNSSQCVEN